MFKNRSFQVKLVKDNPASLDGIEVEGAVGINLEELKSAIKELLAFIGVGVAKYTGLVIISMTASKILIAWLT